VSTRFVRRPGIISRPVGGETVLVPLGGLIVDLKSLLALNETAAHAWRRLARPASVEEIAAGLTRDFAVSAARALRDTRRLVRQLARAGCIEAAGGSPALSRRAPRPGRRATRTTA